MPFIGTRDLADRLQSAPLVQRLDTEPAELSDVQLLQLLFEIDDSAMTSLIPRALHPTIPPAVYVNFMKVGESPWGAFSLAEVRVACRQGARPRALSFRAVCDSPQAAGALRDRWGFPVVQGTVSLTRGYDRVHGVAETPADGVMADVALMNPEAIGSGDVQYISSLHLARVVRDGEEQVRLIQVDPDYMFSGADRGRPLLTELRLGAWGLEGATISWDVSASATKGTVTLPALRYLVDPEKPVLAAVERI